MRRGREKSEGMTSFVPKSEHALEYRLKIRYNLVEKHTKKPVLF
jgi:hypothetical protein